MKAFILIGLVFVIIGMSDCSQSSKPTHPQDDLLKRNFKAHKVDFEKLANMAKEDYKVVRITEDFTWLDNNLSWPRPESELGFSRQRWDEYRHLLRKIGLKKGLSRTESDIDVIFFIASSHGSISEGSEKGYAYIVKEPANLAESLDGLDDKDASAESYVPIYKKIVANWYLYYKQIR